LHILHQQHAIIHTEINANSPATQHQTITAFNNEAQTTAANAPKHTTARSKHTTKQITQNPNQAAAPHPKHYHKQPIDEWHGPTLKHHSSPATARYRREHPQQQNRMPDTTG
jgi:hypothetical protein